jgi:hypothetical protein
VGAPFTNFDLAKLLQLDQKGNKAIKVSPNDDVAGDMERSDVADMVQRLISAKLPPKCSAVFSMVNEKGDSPSEAEWSGLIKSVASFKR